MVRNTFPWSTKFEPLYGIIFEWYELYFRYLCELLKDYPLLNKFFNCNDPTKKQKKPIYQI